MATPIEPSAALRAALHAMVGTLEAFSFRLPAPERETREAERTEVVWSIEEYLLTRLQDLEGPVMAVVVGSTGSGKSTLVNSLAQEPVAEVSAIRPTTRTPVVWAHRRHADRYRDEFLTGYAVEGAARSIRLVPDDDGLLENLTMLDAPDFDSVVAENRQIADDLLAVADLCVFVTTAQRYADAIPWDFLRRAHQRGLPLLFVVNRLPPHQGAAREILDDYARRLAAGGVLLESDPSLLFAIDEQQTDPEHGGLQSRSVRHIREELQLLSDPAVRRQLVRQSTEGAVSDVIHRGRAIAVMVEEEHEQGRNLVHTSRLAYQAQVDEVGRLLQSGALIRDEVLARWQEFVGTGDLLRSLSDGMARFQRWVRSVVGGRSETEQVGREAAEELVAAVTRRADLGAREAAAAWERDPVGKSLLAGSGSLWRHDPETPERAERAIEEWVSEVANMVAERGEGKQRSARLASLGVNAAAVVVLVSVFSQTGGMTGAELGITAGAAAAQQKLLEHLFGTAAAQSLVEQARLRLEEALGAVLNEDARRFEVVVEESSTDPELSDRIVRQVDEVSRQAGRFYAG